MGYLDMYEYWMQFLTVVKEICHIYLTNEVQNNRDKWNKHRWILHKDCRKDIQHNYFKYNFNWILHGAIYNCLENEGW